MDGQVIELQKGQTAKFSDFTLTYVGMQEASTLVDDILVQVLTCKFKADSEFHFYKMRGDFDKTMTFAGGGRSYTMQRIDFTPEHARFIVTRNA